jgi:glyoxylase-like metal-dependent hydrolase (beta-lactamase superfamily II)
MHFGDMEVRHLHAGNFWLDGGAMFGVVPKTLWEKKAPADERNRIKFAANVLLVQASGKQILIETGNGAKWDAKLRQIYGIPEGDGLQMALAHAGVKPEQIDIVINTHLHFDHAGGNTVPSGEQDAPAFPNARYVVQREELEHARNPSERDRASYFADRFEPIADACGWRCRDCPRDNGDADSGP